MPKINLKIVKKVNTNHNSVFNNGESVIVTLNNIKKNHDKPIYKLKNLPNVKPKLKLCDLPKEILELIIGNINIWHHNRIRATCKTFMNVCDSSLMHEYKMSMNKFGKTDPKGYEFAALTAIQQATWSYVHSGYSSLFLGTMLPLMRNSKNPFAPPMKKIKKFLKKFYQLVQIKLGDPMKQHSRFLYTLILLGFFKKFENCKILSSEEIGPEHWRVVYELYGSWFGMLWSSKQPTTKKFGYMTDRFELLMLLTEIMIAAHSENTFKKVWEGDTKVFVCGHDTSHRIRKPKVIFYFDIQGTQSIVNCFKNIPKQDIHLCWEGINKFSSDEFNLFLKISCKEAVNWGCYDDYQFELGPKYKIFQSTA